MTFSRVGRLVLGLVASAALGLGMTACGGGTIGYMWVLGTVPNANTGIITGFKIDNYTGNLTAIPRSPFDSGGANPVSLVVKPGGQFVYVVNAGTPASGSGSSAVAAVPGNIEVFSVGNEGVLVPQQTYNTQGNTPIWATLDTTGSYLYVLDAVSPSGDGNGDISAYSIASDSGRLTTILNVAQSNSTKQIAYFEVGPAPTMVKAGTNGCVYALSSNLIYPLQTGTGGQLTAATTGPYVPGYTHLTSINTGSNGVYLTDGATNTIVPLVAGSTACSLSSAGNGPIGNVSLTSNPVNSLSITSGSNSYLFVLNQSSTANAATPANSSISAFTVVSGQLAPLADPSGNPYSTGSGPVCIVVDPSNQYIYTSDGTSRTVTGKLLNQTHGTLAPLSRGSTFTLKGPPTCLAISPNI